LILKGFTVQEMQRKGLNMPDVIEYVRSKENVSAGNSEFFFSVFSNTIVLE
jgi:hypothetical protein